MKEQKATARSILIHIAQEDISERVNLWPRLQKALVSSQSSSLRGEFKMKSSIAPKTMLRYALVVALVLTAATALLLATPQGRALARNMFHFFNTTDEKSFVLPAEQVLPAPATLTPAPAFVLPLEPYQEIARPEPTKITAWTCNTPEERAWYYCKIKGIEAQAGFDIKEFLYDPKGTKFANATYDTEIQQVIVVFEVSTGGGYIYLRQGINPYTPADDQWSTVPSDSIDQVSVNGSYAEIASGSYVVYPNAKAAVWEPGGMLSLVWREGDHWYVLEKMGDPYPIEWITKEELVKLAEGLVDERPLEAEPPQDPENLKSVADAEKLAGFEVPVPTRLPKGYELKRVLWVYDTVRLQYGSKESKQPSLYIVMGPVEKNQSGPCTECPPGTNENVQIGPWQGWYWQGIFFTGTSVEGQPTPTAVWQADSPNWQLAWNTDSLWIGISFYTNENGLEMNKETLIAIAESMK